MGSMEAQLEALTVEVRSLSRRVDDGQQAQRDRHVENIDRFANLGERIDVVDEKVTRTNGLVADAHMDIAKQQGQIDSNKGDIARLINTSTGVVKEADLKFWGGVIFLACTSTAGVVLWIVHLVQVGKL